MGSQNAQVEVEELVKSLEQLQVRGSVLQMSSGADASIHRECLLVVSDW